jgi:raffinose/stachyose/melibiose transport system substrate-binding protein
MNKRLFSLFILALVAALTLSLSAVAIPRTAAQEKVTIHWWHISTQEDQAAFWQQAADDYMALHPNVSIEITVLENAAFKDRLVTVMQAGDPPDIFEAWGGGTLWEYADAGMLRNIAPELEGAWKDSFSAKAALELFGKDGAYYGVPWTWGMVSMFYNKALFEQAGLDPDNPPATWTDFLAAVQTLKDAGITPISVGEGEPWTGHFWWVYLAIRCGGQDAFLKAYTREGSFADEPFVQAGVHLKELIDLEPFQEGFLGMTHPESEGYFGDGKAAMMLMGQWAPGAMIQYSVNAGADINGGADISVFNFPMVEGGAGNPGDALGGGDGFGIGKNAPDEAIDFVKYLTSPAVQRAGSFFILPTVGRAEDAVTDPILQTILENRNNAPYLQLYYDQFLPPAVGQAVVDGVQGLFAGMTTPQEVAQGIEDAASLELD